MCTLINKFILERAQEGYSLDPVIEVKDLVIGYNGRALSSKLNFKLRGPALVQILGPNGAGKTTLLKTLLGLLKPIEGKVFINGVEVTNPEKAGIYIGYVPQLIMGSGHYPVTAWELVSTLYSMRKKKWPRLRLSKNEVDLLREVFAKVGLGPDIWNKNFWSLSGGERQRVLIARAIVHNPSILLMDEPLSAVDPVGKAELAKLIIDLSREKLVLVTSHDPMLLLEYTDIIILINRKIFIMGSPDEVLTLENTKLVYGEAAIPVAKHVHISDHHLP